MVTAVRSLIPMAHVRDVSASIAFYRKLGFEVPHTFTPEGERVPRWALLQANEARFMIARASEPVIPEQQAVLFYLYCDDVGLARTSFEQAGISVGPIAYPFYAPGGEFRVTDPDGYVLMITHT